MEPPGQLAPYEIQRRQRMARNRQVLVDMGIAEHPLSGVAQAQRHQQQRCRPEKRQAAAQQEPPRPTRRSCRLCGQEADPPPALLPEPPPRIRAPPGRDCSPARMQAHNRMRIATMSDRALSVRAWKITRRDKLESFVGVLRELGRHELAAEAQQALDRLLGGGGRRQSGAAGGWAASGREAAVRPAAKLDPAGDQPAIKLDADAGAGPAAKEEGSGIKQGPDSKEEPGVGQDPGQ